MTLPKGLVAILPVGFAAGDGPTAGAGLYSTSARPLAVSPPSGLAAQVITRGLPRRRVIALTFDAGSDRGSTQRILNILHAQQIKATFSLTGLWAKQYPNMARAIVQAGHQLVNHSYDHRSFTGLSTGSQPLTQRQRRSELNQVDRIFRSVTGRSTKPFFRPPYGEYDAATLRLAGSLGYRYLLMWTVDSLGWKDVPASEVIARSLAASHPGAIILMHVGVQPTDASALPSLITQLKKWGYGFVTVKALPSGR